MKLLISRFLCDMGCFIALDEHLLVALAPLKRNLEFSLKSNCQYSDPMRDRLLLAISQSVTKPGAKVITTISADRG